MPTIKLPPKKDNRIPTTAKRKYQEIYQDKRWKLIRAEKMRANPLCEVCESKGKTKATDEVHHKVPFETGRTEEEREELAFDYANTVSVCVECHKELHKLITISQNGNNF